jgi:hypothetical protein
MTIESLHLFSATRDWIDVLSLAVSFVLMSVGIAGIFVALRTLRAVKRQADEMLDQANLMKEQTAVAEKSAKAALLNAQAVINAERPWLLIDPKRSGEGQSTGITFKAVNRGRSPAEVINSGFKMVTPRFDEELPDKPYFGEGAAPNAQWVHTKWLAPGDDYTADSYYVSAIVEGAPELWTELNNGTRQLILMGFVRYRDTISNEVHESKYCFGVSKLAPNGVYMTGPLGYNRLT